LNFRTSRDRVDILRDYIRILKTINDPVNYYKRLQYTGLHLKRMNKYKPTLAIRARMIKAFFIVCAKVGFCKSTGVLYWKTVWTILLKNPTAIESVVTFATMFIHFAEHSKFIINLINEKIKNIEGHAESNDHQ
jgi:hypothetical protein